MKHTLLLLTFACGLPAAELSEQVFTAIRNNDLTAVRRFADDPAARDVRGRNEFTPLMYAAAFGSLDSVKILTEAGANVNAKDAREATALIYGAWEPARTKLLLSKGADPNVHSKMGQTALIVATSAANNSETVKTLVEKGAAVEGKALINSAGFDLELTKMFLAKGVDVNSTDRGGFTALMVAVGDGRLDIVKFLLANGAKVNVANTFSGKVKHGDIALKNITPLMFAAPNGSPELVKTLLDAGAEVNVRESRGMTPLMLAVSSENQDVRVASALLAKGADVNIRSEVGETALDWARKFGKPAMIALLEKNGAKGIVAEVKVPEAAPVASPRSAVERSFALLQKSSTAFFRESGCPACHNVTITGFALTPLRAAGVAIDEKAVLEMAKTIPASVAPAGPAVLQRVPIGGTFHVATSVLNGLATNGVPADNTSDSFVAYLAPFQNADGSWGSDGGISRSPMGEAVTGRTAFAAKALRSYTWPARQAEFDERIARARAWLLEAKPKTSYARAEQLLGLAWTGATPAQMAKVAKLLVAEQRADGGWSQNAYLASDAYATGIALWALNESRTVPATSATYRLGVDYLMRTQRADGSWYVKSRAPKFQPYFEGGFPYSHDQWISNAATAYAAIALAPAAQAPAAVATR